MTAYATRFFYIMIECLTFFIRRHFTLSTIYLSTFYLSTFFCRRFVVDIFTCRHFNVDIWLPSRHRSDCSQGSMWRGSMWNENNERFDQMVRRLHCFVLEHLRYAVLLVDRSYRRKGSMWWGSMWNKKNERFKEKVGMLHHFVVEQWQGVVLLHGGADRSGLGVWWVSKWSGKKVIVKKDFRIQFIAEFFNTGNCFVELIYEAF